VPSGETRVAELYSNGKTTGCRTTGAEAFELELMNPCYFDIDGFGLRGTDAQGPDCAPITNEQYARLEAGGQLSRKTNSGLEPASVMLQLIGRKSSWVTNVAVERDALGVNRSGYRDRTRVYQLSELPGRPQVGQIRGRTGSLRGYHGGRLANLRACTGRNRRRGRRDRLWRRAGVDQDQSYYYRHCSYGASGNRPEEHPPSLHGSSAAIVPESRQRSILPIGQHGPIRSTFAAGPSPPPDGQSPERLGFCPEDPSHERRRTHDS